MPWSCSRLDTEILNSLASSQISSDGATPHVWSEALVLPYSTDEHNGGWRKEPHSRSCCTQDQDLTWGWWIEVADDLC